MLSREEVLHIARLARLDLKEEEIGKFQNQLSDILDLFKKIDDVDLANVEETSQVTGLKNVLREDKVKCFENLTCCTSEELVENAPLREDTKILVPKVLGEKDDA